MKVHGKVLLCAMTLGQAILWCGCGALLPAEESFAQSAPPEDVCYKDEAGRIQRRRRPGYVEVPCPKAGPTGEPVQTNRPTNASPAAPETLTPTRMPPTYISPVPRPGLADFVDSVPLPDRWRIVDSLGYQEHWWDPYNRNLLKADRPIFGDWFFNVGIISDSQLQLRQVPTPVGGSSTARPNEFDVIGSDTQRAFSQTVATEFVLYEGDTVFKPPDYEIRFTPAFNFNYTELKEVEGLSPDPRLGRVRTDDFVGIQAAFIDKRLDIVSDRFDFDSLRVGIQPFSTDFRGFLFQDNQLGVRLFGTRDNNVYQYNIAYFRRIEKDTNSGLNDVTQPLRHDDVVVFNLYRQDTPTTGFTSQVTAVYNRNREDEGTYYDKNGFQVRPALFGLDDPRHYDVVYLGYNGDGHFGRFNLTASAYYVYGKDRPEPFTDAGATISAAFAAAELSTDFDWIRPRLSLLYASGDKNPYDRKETGFDAILENPQFAGADTSYWISQAIPLIGGGGVALSGPNGVLADLRSSKDEGQSNFTNPGTMLAGVGVDMDVLPVLRLTFNANDIFFANTAVLEAARNQGDISRHLGYDLSSSLIWRPLMSQNIVLRASYAKLISGAGYEQLFGAGHPGYFLFNAILAY
jgi:hypothetical protein